MAHEEEFLRKLHDGVFRVDPDGSVWRLKRISRVGTATPCAPRRAEAATGQGYRAIKLGKKRRIIAHRAVFMVLKGDIPSGFDINHINGDKSDNCPSNLEAVTRSENIRHSYDVLGATRPAGEINGGSKLTEASVARIREAGHVQASVLAQQFNISRSAIYKIREGRTWVTRCHPGDEQTNEQEGN